jgi:RND superfamily putative drug exporter
MRAAGSAAEPREPTTTRFSAQKNAAPKPTPGRERQAKTSAAPPPGPIRRDDREAEFEAWISELRGPKPNERPGDPRGASHAAPPSQPSADNTRAMPVPTDRPAGQPPADEDDSTTAIPTAPRDANDPDAASENLNSRGRNANADRSRQRRGGGLSAQDLLRREGRF